MTNIQKRELDIFVFNKVNRCLARYSLRATTTNQGCAGRPFIPRGGAGRGKGKNPRGGAGRGEGENPRGGAKKRANQPIQKFYKSAKNIILHIIILIII